MDPEVARREAARQIRQRQYLENARQYLWNQPHPDAAAPIMSPSISSGIDLGSSAFALPARSYEAELPPIDPEDDTASFRAQIQALRASVYGFPVRVNDVAVTARGAVVTDTTRLDPLAAGLFLPYAIPVAGEASFGLATRTHMQGQGSSVSLSWLADVGSSSPLSGALRVSVQDVSATAISVITPQAWLRWDKFLFGISDSAFTDMDAIPDTIDINGPNGRPWNRNGQAQIRYTYITPFDPKVDPTGFYGNVSIENPSAEIYAPTVMGQGGYTAFSRYPDLIATLRYQQGTVERNDCTGGKVYDPWFHIQGAAIVRDLGVERQLGNIHETVPGWGTQLSGRYTIFRTDSCGDPLRDYLMASCTLGAGIAHYFNDLRMISAVNDAAYESTTNTLTALPMSAFFVGYQHSWTQNLRSTAVYSRIHLDSQQITNSTGILPYENGEIFSCNLMWHAEPCVLDKEKNKMVEHNLFVGLEYLYGSKENLLGAAGDNHRVMFVIAASK